MSQWSMKTIMGDEDHLCWSVILFLSHVTGAKSHGIGVSRRGFSIASGVKLLSWTGNDWAHWVTTGCSLVHWAINISMATSWRTQTGLRASRIRQYHMTSVASACRYTERHCPPTGPDRCSPHLAQTPGISFPWLGLILPDPPGTRS